MIVFTHLTGNWEIVKRERERERENERKNPSPDRAQTLCAGVLLVSNYTCQASLAQAMLQKQTTLKVSVP